jgi:hypothetical protein
MDYTNSSFTFTEANKTGLIFVTKINFELKEISLAQWDFEKNQFKEMLINYSRINNDISISDYRIVLNSIVYKIENLLLVPAND